MDKLDKTSRTIKRMIFHARLCPEKATTFVVYNEHTAQHLRDEWATELTDVPNLTITSLEKISHERSK